MLKTYTGNINTLPSETIILIGFAIHNTDDTNNVFARAYLMGPDNTVRSEILDMQLGPKETVFLDTKLMVGYGDTLIVEGADFTMTGNYKNDS